MLLPMPEVVDSDTEPPLEACVAADVGVAGVLVMTAGGTMDTAPTLLFFMTAVGTGPLVRLHFTELLGLIVLSPRNLIAWKENRNQILKNLICYCSLQGKMWDNLRGGCEDNMVM